MTGIAQLIGLRIAEIQNFMATFQIAKDVFLNGAHWMGAQFILLSLKSEGTLPVKSLVFELSNLMSEATAHRLIRQCIKCGYLRLVETRDRRTLGVCLSEKGEVLVEQVISTKAELMSKKGVCFKTTPTQAA
jgi:predicted transcriptional regulator